jgi:C_GCAxxG_C_C family probable redox protein
MVMTRKDDAQALFKEGFSCSQAVLAAFAADEGLDRELALRISQPFGGGIARLADWCGAVTGALMVIGLRHGRTRAADIAARDKTYDLVRQFVKEFTARRGAVRCRDLLGCDIGTPAGAKEAEDRHLHENLCQGLIADAVEILENLLPGR